MNLIYDLSQYRSTLLLIPSTEYNDIITLVSKQLSNDKKICYVTLNKTHNSLKNLFRNAGDINLENIIFIDAITCSISKIADEGDCYFVSSPQALTELSITINECLQKKIDYVIFDSLTTVLIYHRGVEEPVMRFITNITNLLEKYDCKGIFYALNVVEHKLFLNESSMVVDKIIQLDSKELLEIQS